MKIIINDEEKTTIINKSKFIGYIKKVYTKEEIDNILINLKKEYPDATHICYAYILNNSLKYSDDGEPIGTAGLPILNVLKMNNLNYCLGVVVRYFGGIKLGSNGLIRAYSNSIKDLLVNNIKEQEDAYLIEIIEEYFKSQEIDYLLKDSTIISKEYQDKLLIKVIVTKEVLEKLINIHYTIIQKTVI